MRKMIKSWLKRCGAARYATLAFTVLVAIVTVIYIPAHVAFEHGHDHDHVVSVTLVPSDSHHDDGDAQVHEAADHALKTIPVHAMVAIPQSCSDIVLIVLLFAPPLIPIVDLEWCPDCMGKEHLPPGPSRAPPV